MSNRWPAGIVRKTPITPTGPLQNGAASGVWSLADAAYWTKQGLWPTAGNILAVEDVFSTWLYTGNGTAQTITNGLDLAGKGGLVWTKVRNNTFNHILADTTRGGNNVLYSNSSVGNQAFGSTIYTAFGSAGYTLGNANEVNGAFNYASWTFREAPKFFDVVTYTGTGANRTIAHSLGVEPGCILIKQTNTSGDWQVYHRGTGNTQYTVLNTTAAAATGATRWNSTTPTATEFTVGTDATVNASGGTYVAYLFAHDAASTGIIQCGSYTGNGSSTGPVVTLGWEPQWLMVKRSTGTAANWQIIDNMRGMPVGTADAALRPSAASVEASIEYVSPTSTGFQITSLSGDVNTSGASYIYIAIRRGPMKTPTLGTSVFGPVARTGTGVNATVSAGFVTDMVIEGNRTASTPGTKFGVWNRQRGIGYLNSNSSNGSFDGDDTMIQANPWDVMDGYKVGTTSTLTNASGDTFINWMFRRAPSFFDQVIYDGTGVARTINHNLGVVPELMLVKGPTASGNWAVYSANIANTQLLNLNSAAAATSGTTVWNSTTPNATTFTVGTNATVNTVSDNYIAFLFATCSGVSKVGGYTGNGSSQTINCGFAAGARFVMIKRTDSTGDWYVWDTARGIVAGNDPYLSLNTLNSEVTTNDTVDTDNSGFVVNQVAATNVNVSSATYIFLAIA